MTKNCTIDKVKLIMQAGNFNTMNDVISKFVNNSVLYYNNYTQRGGNRGRGGRGNFRGRGNNYGYYNNTNQNNGRGNYRGNSRGRGNSSGGYNNNNTSNVRVANDTSGNSEPPLNVQQ
ncbi:N66 matrix protein-like [Drosophila elegans]|uniref:N66 matrix protein-like n=1 Tax=Drosophila elegans TaxID=30023 RepID=UPI001BC82DF1|nr:N66 matrix protein-like [Drosophila elegans]